MVQRSTNNELVFARKHAWRSRERILFLCGLSWIGCFPWQMSRRRRHASEGSASSSEKEKKTVNIQKEELKYILVEWKRQTTAGAAIRTNEALARHTWMAKDGERGHGVLRKNCCPHIYTRGRTKQRIWACRSRVTRWIKRWIGALSQSVRRRRKQRI